MLILPFTGSFTNLAGPEALEWFTFQVPEFAAAERHVSFFH